MLKTQTPTGRPPVAIPKIFICLPRHCAQFRRHRLQPPLKHRCTSFFRLSPLALRIFHEDQPPNPPDPKRDHRLGRDPALRTLLRLRQEPADEEAQQRDAAGHVASRLRGVHGFHEFRTPGDERRH